MIHEEINEFIKVQPKCSFATIDNDTPKVRMFWTWYVDEKGIYFHTPKKGNAYRQMLKNQNIEMCYFQEESQKVLRIAGKVKFINEKDMIDKLLIDRPFLKELSEHERPEDVYGIFMLERKEIVIRS